jgi:hypothetical protein
MPFMSALSAGQITQVRKTNQEFKHFLLVNPNDIVWQAQLNDTKSSENYASFAWDNEQTGVRANVIADMVCMITTATDDFSDPVVRGRVRVVPSVTTFFINEVSTDIDDTMYITVFDDFDIVERLARIGDDSTKYKDYSLTFQKTPPTIDGLQSVYADLSGDAAVVWSFTPTATAQDEGAAISSWLWDVGDGTITVGSTTTQNITVSFPNTSEHRWVHLTVTDDNDNSTAFHFEVYTVDPASATAVKLDAGEFDITAAIADGYNATVTVWAGFEQSNVMDQTRVAIVSIDDYDGTTTPIVSNIMMVGRLRTEISDTVGDETHGVVTDAQLTIEGFATQLARLVAQPVYIVDNGSPDSWGEIDSPDPTRAIVYFLLFHTTYLGLSSFSSADLSGFISGDFSLGEPNAVENINKQAQSVNAMVFFAPSGETTVQRLASYTPDADRAGLTTVFDFTTADSIVIGLSFEYGKTVGEVETGAVGYNTTTDKINREFIGRAPAQSFGVGYETTQLDGQFLTADASGADARTEVAQRSADHLAYVNPKERIPVTLMDGFWWMIPNLYQRFTFTLAATDSTRGRVFTTSEKWQLVDISYSPVNETGIRPIQATFERETQGENAGILVTRVRDVNALEFTLPPLGGYDYFADDPLMNYPIDNPDEADYFEDGAYVMEPYPEGNNQQSPVGAESFDVPLFSNQTISTTNNTVNGELYTVTVSGEGKIGNNWSHTWDFEENDGDWAPTAGFPLGTYVAGFGWDDTDGPTTATEESRGVRIQSPTFTATPLTSIKMVLNQESRPAYFWNPNLATSRVVTYENVVKFKETPNQVGIVDVTGAEHEFIGTVADQTYVRAILHSSNDNAAPYNQNGSATITSIVITGTGVKPPELPGGDSTTGQRGDSFYKNYDVNNATAYNAAKGLLIDGGKPATLPSYAGSHTYQFSFTGTGAPFAFQYVDPDADYSDNDNNFIRVTVSGPGMSPTSL